MLSAAELKHALSSLFRELFPRGEKKGYFAAFSVAESEAAGPDPARPGARRPAARRRDSRERAG